MWDTYNTVQYLQSICVGHFQHSPIPTERFKFSHQLRVHDFPLSTYAHLHKVLFSLNHKNETFPAFLVALLSGRTPCKLPLTWLFHCYVRAQMKACQWWCGPAIWADLTPLKFSSPLCLLCTFDKSVKLNQTQPKFSSCLCLVPFKPTTASKSILNVQWSLALWLICIGAQ